MTILLFLFGVAVAAGLFFILADILKLPRLSTEKALLSAGRAEKKRMKSLDAIFLGWAIKLSKYPDNLSAKATLWLWELRDIGIIGVGLLLSVLALTQTGIALPLVLTVVFAFLTIRHEGTSILDFIGPVKIYAQNCFAGSG